MYNPIIYRDILDTECKILEDILIKYGLVDFTYDEEIFYKGMSRVPVTCPKVLGKLLSENNEFTGFTNVPIRPIYSPEILRELLFMYLRDSFNSDRKILDGNDLTDSNGVVIHPCTTYSVREVIIKFFNKAISLFHGENTDKLYIDNYNAMLENLSNKELVKDLQFVESMFNNVIRKLDKVLTNRHTNMYTVEIDNVLFEITDHGSIYGVRYLEAMEEMKINSEEKDEDIINNFYNNLGGNYGKFRRLIDTESRPERSENKETGPILTVVRESGEDLSAVESIFKISREFEEGILDARDIDLENLKHLISRVDTDSVVELGLSIYEKALTEATGLRRDYITNEFKRG